MTWTAELFQKRHGEVGVAAAAGLVSGLGNLGSVFGTYALWSGWPADATNGYGYRDSNLVAIGVVAVSILCAFGLQFAVALEDRGSSEKSLSPTPELEQQDEQEQKEELYE